MKTRSATDQVKENLSSSTPSLPLSTSKRGSAPPTIQPSLASSASSFSSTTESSSTSNVTEPSSASSATKSCSASSAAKSSLASSAIMAPVSIESVSPRTPPSSSPSSAPSSCNGDVFPSSTSLVASPSPQSASSPSTWAAAQNGSDKREVTVQDVRDACVSSKTQCAYRGCLAVISRWIRSTKGDDAPMYFTSTSQLDLTYITPSDFEAFLLEKRKRVSVGTLSGYRSAIKDLYRRREIPLPAAYEKGMATFFSGLKRMEASKLQSGSPKESGKDPIPFSLYRELCRSTLARQDGGFAHMFLTTQWNLMCRSESVQTLCTEHMSCHDDSVGCIMYKSKTNQEGSGPKDPRHMYANPLSPETCWITSLALYLACRPMQSPGLLFPGSEQKARFGGILRKLISELKQQTHYGTHSIRKGVATFACSGSTGGPSIASVCLRVGWSLGGVQDRYFRYEAAGDQFLGRVVAGLPLNRLAFAVLPPHLKDNEDPTLRSCVQEMYPSLHKVSGLSDILKLCIASLVKHSVFLRKALPQSHPLLFTSLFRNEGMLSELSGMLAAGDETWMTPTGIPPHVDIYKQLQGVQQSIDNLPPVLIDGMSELIESKGVAAGNITRDVLESTIESALERAGLARAQAEATQISSPESSSSTAHYYNGKFHMLPETFEFPKVGAYGAWQLWWFGDKTKGYPPLKRVGTHDLPREQMRKTFSDWTNLVKRIAVSAAEAGYETRLDMTQEQAQKIFRVGMENLPLLASTRKRRVSELSLGTTLRLARQAASKRSRGLL